MKNSGIDRRADQDQDHVHRHVVLGAQHGVGAAGAALAIRLEPGGDAAEQRLAQLEQRPHAADEHAADAEIARDVAVDHVGGVERVCTLTSAASSVP